MIEKMKMVYVVSSLSRKKEMLDGLEKLGVLHIAEKKGAVHAVTEKFTELSRLTASLAEYLPDKKEQKNRPAKPLLQGEEFEKFYGEVKGAVERKAALEQELSVLHAEIERVSPWGDITSEDLELLKDRKYDLYFYRVPASTYAALTADEERQVIHLKDIKKEVLICFAGATSPVDAWLTNSSVILKDLNSVDEKILFDLNINKITDGTVTFNEETGTPTFTAT